MDVAAGKDMVVFYTWGHIISKKRFLVVILVPMYIDRTDEFFALVSAVRPSARVVVATDTPNTRTKLGHTLYQTSLNLEALMAAVRAPMVPFGQASQVNVLTAVVKTNMDVLRLGVVTLDPAMRHVLDVHIREKEHDFKQVLRTHANALQALAARRERLGVTTSTTSLIPVTDDNAFVTIQIPSTADPMAQLLMTRAHQIQDIEAQIMEVHAMYQQMAEHVAIQNEQILRIDDNVMMSAMHAEEAHGHLLHYLASVSSNRWLLLSLFGVLLIFILLFVVVML